MVTFSPSICDCGAPATTTTQTRPYQRRCELHARALDLDRLCRATGDWSPRHELDARGLAKSRPLTSLEVRVAEIGLLFSLVSGVVSRVLRRSSEQRPKPSKPGREV